MSSNSTMNSDGNNTHKACGATTKGRPRCEQAAVGFSRILALPETYLPTSQQVALLVSGSILMCSWQYVSAILHNCESRSVHSLLEVWALVGVALGVGQLARVLARRVVRTPVPPSPANDSQHQVSRCSSSSDNQYSAVQDSKAGNKDVIGLNTRLERQYTPEDVDDVGRQKKAAQAQAAAKLAECQSNLQRLLSSISKSSEIRSSADALHQLARQLFNSPIDVCELVGQGGVPVVIAAARSALQALEAQDRQDQQSQQEVMPALLQVSWILLQVAHGPTACQSQLLDQDIPLLLLSLSKAVMTTASTHPNAQDCILRNLCWVLLLLCEERCTSAAGEACSTSANCRSAIMQAEVVNVLQPLVTLQHGAEAAWVAAATLSLLIELEYEKEQQHEQQKGAVCAACVQAVLQPDSLHGLSYLLHHKPQLSDRLQGLVYGLVHYLLTHHAAQLLQLLVEQQLVGSFAAGLTPRLSRLLVCQLLSSSGQEVLADIEAQYELDVPLALAQIIPLPVHVKLPCTPGIHQQQPQQEHQQQEQQIHNQDAEVEPADQGMQPAQGASAHEGPATAHSAPLHEDVYTDVLACRLLLQHDRLVELFAAFAEEPPSVQQQGNLKVQQAPCSTNTSAIVEDSVEDVRNMLSPVCDGVLKLCQHLMSHDLELQAVQHLRGDSVDDSQHSSSCTSSSVLDAALASADESGVYSGIMAGLVPSQQLPGHAAGTATAVVGGDEQRSINCELQLPPLSEPTPVAVPSMSDTVVFRFGSSEHAVNMAMYKQIRNSSKIIHSILCRLGKHPKQPVMVFSIPHFTPEANCWVLQCLERWLTTGQLQGFSAEHAAKLWVAADFLQVDGLQVACEDVITAFAADHVQHVDVALELCSRHRAGSSRLQRLVAQVLLRGIRDAGEAVVFRDRLLQLQRLMHQHKSVLLPALLAEIRDRLVAVCMLNVGLNAEACYDVM